MASAPNAALTLTLNAQRHSQPRPHVFRARDEVGVSPKSLSGGPELEGSRFDLRGGGRKLPRTGKNDEIPC